MKSKQWEQYDKYKTRKSISVSADELMTVTQWEKRGYKPKDRTKGKYLKPNNYSGNSFLYLFADEVRKITPEDIAKAEEQQKKEQEQRQQKQREIEQKAIERKQKAAERKKDKSQLSFLSEAVEKENGENNKNV